MYGNGEVANDQEPGGCWNEQRGYLPTGGDQEINSPWDPQIGVRKTYPLKSVDLFIYSLSMFLVSNKEFFVGQLSVGRRGDVSDSFSSLYHDRTIIDFKES